MRFKWFRFGLSKQELMNAILAQNEQIESIKRLIDARIWETEERNASLAEELGKSVDARIWKAEERNASLAEELGKAVDARIWKAENLLQAQLLKMTDELHRHIDFTYRDLMVALERQGHFLPETGIWLITDAPIAYESLDHLHPHGTIRDNTRYPRFVAKCEELLGTKENLSFLDLGCSGGGMVLDATLRGHVSMGLEGSDCSLKEQRAEWRLLGDRLQTCDITKPFQMVEKSGRKHQFDIITAWEVMEHIAETDLPQLFRNVFEHLSDRGYFICSIANWDDIDPESGVNWHVTVHPYEWWKERFEAAGFEVCPELLNTADLPRGGYNPPHCYETPYSKIDTQIAFHIAARKGR